jgi:DNA (cytosine-5)-methyltransferase 1
MTESTCRQPRLLDLFCGAGGAAMGYHRAGFEVVGVDIKPQPHFPFEFHQADALEFPLDGFDVIHASPPCQAHTALKTAWNAKEHPDLLTPTLERLKAITEPWVVENVPGAPMLRHLVLCGTMFGLGIDNAELRRHRWFEVRNWDVPVLRTPCAHKQNPITIGVYGQHGRDRRRSVQTFFSVEDGRQAMGIDWMTGDELSQAIPPAYTEYIGRQLLMQIKGK